MNAPILSTTGQDEESELFDKSFVIISNPKRLLVWIRQSAEVAERYAFCIAVNVSNKPIHEILEEVSFTPNSNGKAVQYNGRDNPIHEILWTEYIFASYEEAYKVIGRVLRTIVKHSDKYIDNVPDILTNEGVDWIMSEIAQKRVAMTEHSKPIFHTR